MDVTEIRPLRTMEEMRVVVELQKLYWGDNLESIIPAHMLFSLASHGGHVLAAYDRADVVGVVIGFLGTSEQDTERPAMANLQIVSKRMVVRPEYRNQGVGYRLKLAQRDLAREQGIRLVTWTFDPLLAANAHLNVRKLGATCQNYLVDFYGPDEPTLSVLGSSDRLLAEWWVTNRRVEERIFGTRSDLTLAHYLEADTTIVNPATRTADGVLVPAEANTTPTTSLALVEIPLNFSALVSANPDLARTWRAHYRLICTRLFESGYIITDFLREPYEGRERAFYLFSYNGPQFDAINLN